MSTTAPLDLEKMARRRVAARLGWLAHALIYLVVMGGLSAAALWQGRHLPVAAALGWGLGLALHGLRVLMAGSVTALRERLVEAERQRLLARRSA